MRKGVNIAELIADGAGNIRGPDRTTNVGISKLGS